MVNAKRQRGEVTSHARNICEERAYKGGVDEYVRRRGRPCHARRGMFREARAQSKEVQGKQHLREPAREQTRYTSRWILPRMRTGHVERQRHKTQWQEACAVFDSAYGVANAIRNETAKHSHERSCNESQVTEVEGALCLSA